MRLKHAAVPAAALVMSFGAFAAPAEAAPPAGLHCADYTSPEKVELDGDESTVFVGYEYTTYCVKAGPVAFEEVEVVDGYITSPNGKGISYYIPGEECVDNPSLGGDDCDPSS